MTQRILSGERREKREEKDKRSNGGEVHEEVRKRRTVGKDDQEKRGDHHGEAWSFMQP